MTTLYVRDGMNYCEATADDILGRAKNLLAQRFRSGSPVLSSPSLLREFLRVRLGALDHEVFCCVHLDSRYRLIAFEEMFRGTIDGASVYPREVVKAALRHGAASLVAVHNHPSGIAKPSHADEIITQRIKEALALVDVRLVDHLIVGEQLYSFAEAGLL